MEHLISSFGYAAVFLLMVAESACIPVPSEVTMLFGGYLAATGRLELALVIALGTLGNLVGSYLAWAVGRTGGRAVWHRFGRLVLVKDEDLARAEAWFDRRGEAAVFLGRFLPVVRTFISLPAGMADMAPLRFGLYTLAGCLPWSAALAVVGYELRGSWHSLVGWFSGATYVIASAIILAGLAFLWVRMRRGRPAGTGPASRRGSVGSRR